MFRFIRVLLQSVHLPPLNLLQEVGTENVFHREQVEVPVERAENVQTVGNQCRYNRHRNKIPLAVLEKFAKKKFNFITPSARVIMSLTVVNR